MSTLIRLLSQRFWASLEAVAQTRARPELLALASRYEASQPLFAAQLRHTATASQH